MTNNDILRRIRYALELTDAQMGEAFAHGGVKCSKKEIISYMAREHEEDAVYCTPALLGQFLDGLIILKRGPRKDGAPLPPPPKELTNNDVFKKLRIALSMQEKEVLAAMAAGGQKLSKGELTALFRNPNHKHYRLCGDQILRNFLNGITRLRRSPKAAEEATEKAEEKATEKATEKAEKAAKKKSEGPSSTPENPWGSIKK